MTRDKNERRHRRTDRHPESVAMMANADFSKVPSLSEAMGLESQPQPSDQPKPYKPTLTEADPVGWYECRYQEESEKRRTVVWFDGELLRNVRTSPVTFPVRYCTDFHGPLTVMPAGWEEVVEACRTLVAIDDQPPENRMVVLLVAIEKARDALTKLDTARPEAS